MATSQVLQISLPSHIEASGDYSVLYTANEVYGTRPRMTRWMIQEKCLKKSVEGSTLRKLLREKVVGIFSYGVN